MSVERNVLWRRYRIRLNLFRKITRYFEQPVVYAGVRVCLAKEIVAHLPVQG